MCATLSDEGKEARMAMASTEWQVREGGENDDGEIQALLERDRVWNSFALADLLPPLWQYTRFVTAAHPGEPPSALVMSIQHPGFSAVSPFGAGAGVAAILDRISLPQRTLVQTTAAHRPLLERRYRPAPAWLEMLRMAVTERTFTPAAVDERVTHVAHVARLGAADGAEVDELYRLFPEGHFRPDLLDEGVFYGLRAGGSLRAIAGTHVVAEPFGVAVVGNVFTHPDARGNGYAGAVTSAVVANLLARGCHDVVLNVFVTNTPAIAVYRRLGFQTAHYVWSGQAELRQESQEKTP